LAWLYSISFYGGGGGGSDRVVGFSYQIEQPTSLMICHLFCLPTQCEVKVCFGEGNTLGAHFAMPAHKFTIELNETI